MLLLVNALILYLTWGPRRQQHFLRGWNDFLAFYAGGRLAFTPHLYDPPSVAAVELQAAGISSDTLRFIRPPHYAMLLAAIAWMPYLPAYVLWLFLNAGSLAAAVFIWPYSRRILACVLAVLPPVYWGWSLGQDTGLVVLAMSAAFRYLHLRRDRAAGLALGAALIKFHFLWLIPFVLRRRRLTLAAWLAFAFAAAAISFAANPGWPRQYFEHVVRARALVSKTPFTLFALLGWAVLPAAAAAQWAVTRRYSTETALASALALAVAVSPHAYLYDYALFAPALALGVERVLRPQN